MQQVQPQNEPNDLLASLTRYRIQVEFWAGFIVAVDVQERRGLVSRVLPSFQHLWSPHQGNINKDTK